MSSIGPSSIGGAGGLPGFLGAGAVGASAARQGEQSQAARGVQNRQADSVEIGQRVVDGDLEQSGDRDGDGRLPYSGGGSEEPLPNEEQETAKSSSKAAPKQLDDPDIPGRQLDLEA